MVAPHDQSVTIRTHSISHQVIFEDLAVRMVALLIDDAQVNALDQRTKLRLSHSRHPAYVRWITNRMLTIGTVIRGPSFGTASRRGVTATLEP